jgi:hypothetical protein
VGIPNVRAAESADEQEALTARLGKARLSAAATNSSDALDHFQAAAAHSEAVVAIHLMPFATLLESPGGMISTFYGMVDAGARAPNNEHDVLRGVLDQAVNPLKVHEQIRFAALSLNRRGLSWFGEIFVTLRDDAIAGRASVFEENPLTFFDNKGPQPTKPIPAGYRAPWNRRGDLAAAKLQPKIREETNEAEYAGILMEQSSGSDVADYIEVHIYGPVMPKAFASVCPINLRAHDKAIWKRARRKLDDLGTLVIEN